LVLLLLGVFTPSHAVFQVKYGPCSLGNVILKIT